MKINLDKCHLSTHVHDVSKEESMVVQFGLEELAASASCASPAGIHTR